LLILNTAVALLGGALLAGALPAPAQQTSSGAAAPATGAPTTKKPSAAGGTKGESGANADVSYSLGVSMGDQLRATGVSPDEVSSARLAQGVHDALSGKVKLTDADKQNIGGLLRTAHEAQGERNHRAAAKFLAENAKKPEVVTTASGLQYKVLRPGSGTSPKPTDEVTVNYRGTLLDGTEFDSSYKRGQPATFIVSRVIPGWTEALQLMKPGSKYQLFLPPQLAYDLRSPPPIPPGSMLIFDVELLSAQAPPPPAGMPPATPGTSPHVQPGSPPHGQPGSPPPQ